MTSAQQETIVAAGCEVAFDNLNRQLYATDASIYQIEPVGVAFPRSARQASAVIQAAIDAGVSIIPRGAGTSLSGGAIGDGLIVEFSRYNRQISDLDLEKRSVRVGAGVVLDQLNAFLQPHGFCFGPDVATSSRATIGGMVANNSSGAHVPVYGTTADHIRSLEIVLADGRIENIGANYDSLSSERRKIAELVRQSESEIAAQMPPGLLKRWPGYGIERFLRAPNLAEIVAGSEGTLAAIFSAELKISPVPREKGLGLIFLASVEEAMEATVELLDLKPAAIEHIDRPLLDQTKGQLLFQGARDLLGAENEAAQFHSLLSNLRRRIRSTGGFGNGAGWSCSKVRPMRSEMDLVLSQSAKPWLSLLTGCVWFGEAGLRERRRPQVRPARKLPDYARFEINHEAAGAYGFLYGHSGRWPAARPGLPLDLAQRKTDCKNAAGCRIKHRRSLGSSWIDLRTWCRDRAHGIHGGTTRRGTVRFDARDQENPLIRKMHST